VKNKYKRKRQRKQQLIQIDEESRQPETKENDSSNENPSVKSDVSIIAKIMPTDLKPKKTNECQHNPTPWWKTIMEVAALCFGIGYAIVTGLQWWDLRQDFRIEQRAWINLSQIWPDMSQIKEGTNIIILVRPSNTGKTPAKRAGYRFKIVMPDSDQEVRFDYSGIITSGFNGLMPPNATADIQVQMMGADHRPLLLTKEEADDLISGRRYVAIFGQGEFEDVFGNIHWWHYCRWTSYYSGSTTVAADSCTAYNNAGDGDLPK
jgi:hypothetical protein